MHPRRRLVAIIVPIVTFLAVAALAAPPEAALVDRLNASTVKLVAQNEALKDAIAKYEKAAAERTAVATKLAATRKTLAATKDRKLRSELEAQVRSMEKNVSGLLAAIIEYQKVVAKEAREDRELSRTVAELNNALKAAALKQDNKSIDKGMEEAREKADVAMDSARIQLASGVVSTALAITGVTTRARVTDAGK
jgi:hypothetical protein